MMSSTRDSKSGPLATLARWPLRRWLVAAVAAVVVGLVVGVPTDVIPNPVFGRPVPVTWWSYPVLVLTAILGGMVAATYVNVPEDGGSGLGGASFDDDLDPESERVAKTGGAAGLLSVFAVGCPVCNHLVVLAIGVTGARQWFEPFQPVLAVVSLGLLAYALLSRLRWAESCPLPATNSAADNNAAGSAHSTG